MFELFRLEADDKLRELDAGLRQLQHGAAPVQPLALCLYAANALKDAAHMAGLPMAVSLIDALEGCLGAVQRGRVPLRENTVGTFQRGIELLGRIARAPAADAGQWGGELRAEVEVVLAVLHRMRDGSRTAAAATPATPAPVAPAPPSIPAPRASEPPLATTLPNRGRTPVAAATPKPPLSATWPHGSIPRNTLPAPGAGAGSADDPSLSALAATWPEEGRAKTVQPPPPPMPAVAAPPTPPPAVAMADEEGSLFDLFRQESEDLTQALLSNLRVLRQDPYAPRQLESCTRAAHSFKGAARICGLTMLVGLTRALEECFAAAEKKTIDLKRDSLDLLAATVDLLGRIARQPSADAGQWGGEQRAEVESYLHALQRLRSGEAFEIPASAPGASS